MHMPWHEGHGAPRAVWDQQHRMETTMTHSFDHPMPNSDEIDALVQRGLNERSRAFHEMLDYLGALFLRRGKRKQAVASGFSAAAHATPARG